MIIRRADEKDSAALLDLLRQVLSIHRQGRPDVFRAEGTKYGKDELRELIENANTPIFVAEKDARVVGYCFCIVKITKDDNVLQDMKTLYIDDLCIDRSARGESIGRALYEHARDYAKEIGCYNLTLNVWECNEGARRFYDKMGLKPQKTILEQILD